ncbi:KamA family radical SAM protein [Enterococcus sp. BWT-B8]|uniref:KamA family radical SAM protein n=1 Tax=Enterococcus sp. BWT-B8 TaxID=2885157 RepID=UPI00226CB7B2|nr:KamA family radical SAM protein [Enterococcus sp. BWT-B8]MCB5951128.1 KamA family radical SAM protein [Enterococcus sp. BWT-B8]
MEVFSMLTNKEHDLIKKYSDNSNDTLEKIEEINEIFPVKISSYLSKIIEQKSSSGIAKQFLPDSLELVDKDGVGAFFSDEIEVSKNTYQKYPNRCIIYTSSTCFAHCRFCSRKENWKKNIPFSKTDFDFTVKDIRRSPQIEEVLLTGGDALTITDTNLEYMINSLSEIDHIKIIRLGTRAFTMHPSRITDKLCITLEKYKKLVISTQFNHPEEFTNECISSIRKIQKTGIPILNQSVLLKGINDDITTLRSLLTCCASNRVIPYYLFHCFKVKGVQHFRTHPLLGKQLLDKLIGEIGGWWIPRYILIPESTGVKVPVCHYGVLPQPSNSDSLFLKDFKNRIIPYD